MRQDPVTAALPMFHVTWRKVENWFFKRQDLNAYLAQVQEETGQSLDDLTASSISDSLSLKSDFDENAESDAQIRVVELYEIRTLNSLLSTLREKFLFEIDSLFKIERTGEEGSRYALLRGDAEIGVEDLRSLLTTIREGGEKGLQITRFKGLGEMDPEELRETTLDPNNRKLNNITMSDVAEADDMFRVLMGEQVEPRREFIERNALDAKLDV